VLEAERVEWIVIISECIERRVLGCLPLLIAPMLSVLLILWLSHKILISL
jgi:hypothetical protein